MTGERWEWFRVASHLNIPVWELQNRISYNEFLDWLVYLEKAVIERDIKHDYYLAQIAAEVCRSRLAHPGKIKNSDFLIRFKTPTDVSTEGDLKADRIKRSKSAWGMAVKRKLN